MRSPVTAAARKVEFRLTRPQSKAFKIFRTPRSDLNLEWGRGCGKSWFDRFIAWSWIAEAGKLPRLELLDKLGVGGELTPEQRQKAAEVRGVRVVFLCPTHKQFVDIHGRLLKQENDGTWSQLRGRLNGTTYQVGFDGGSFIAPFPASEHGSKRALGLRADVVICDEADDIDINVFDTIVRPWFSEPWSLKIRVTSGTPRRGRHGLLYARRVAGRDPTQPRYHTIHATYRDNPEIVDITEVEDARKNTPKETFEREWECNYDAGEGLVYPFDEAFHVRPPPPLSSFNEFHVGMDHGWVDPAVLLLCGVIGHGEDAELWVLDEKYETECPNEIWNARAAEWGHAMFWPDPSRPDRINDLRSLNISVGNVDNKIDAGVARVANLLFKRETEDGSFARIYVAPNCVNTIREFGLYRWKKNSDGTFSDEPADKSNHAMDSLRYVAVGRFGRTPNFRHETSGR